VGQLDAADVEPFLDTQQPAVDQGRQRSGRGAGLGEGLQHPLLGDVLAKARVGEQLVLDEAAHARWLVGQCPFVELGEDVGVRAGQQVGRDLGAALREARRVQLAADQAQQRGFDLGVAQLGAAGDEAHDGLGDLQRDEPAARLGDRVERLLPGHARQPHAVLRDAGHRGLQRLQVRQVVLAQRDQDAVVAAREVEALGDAVVDVELGLQGAWRPVLHQVGELVDELRRARPAGVVALGEGEDLLELVEDQQRCQRAAVGVAQLVVAVVQELPERLARLRGAGLRPGAGVQGLAEDRLLDLLGRRRRVAGVVQPHVDRAVALGAQPRHQAGAQDRGLTQAALAEQHGERLALHAPGELGDLLLAAVEKRARRLGERVQPQPGLLRVDGRVAHGPCSHVARCRASVAAAV
jgi:hypothetical protein